MVAVGEGLLSRSCGFVCRSSALPTHSFADRKPWEEHLASDLLPSTPTGHNQLETRGPGRLAMWSLQVSSLSGKGRGGEQAWKMASNSPILPTVDQESEGEMRYSSPPKVTQLVTRDGFECAMANPMPSGGKREKLKCPEGPQYAWHCASSFPW